MGNNFKKIANEELQPDNFSFSNENLLKAKDIVKMYPKNYRESSIMPLLSMAQSQNDGWLPKKAIEYVSKFLNVPEMKVLEIATFYSMYNLSPVGKHHIEICTTSPCMLRGSDNLLEKLKNWIGINTGEITDDNKFSLNRVECLGACVNAPVVKINENYYEDLDLQSFEELINKLSNNKNVKMGPQSSRKGSEPKK
ncbi:MAG: NADH-quinone oxidoreductase subunit NuoE [alpha proteobacterium MED-G10]|nr:MAG: NADH-quinone oxidoreductase subunit NuoE [alpha proteobacterium MED-G10]|tara:strand:+ start:2273 stop:2860 length:588 start_codon:yes stop_codon:yes gene_type:complete